MLRIAIVDDEVHVAQDIAEMTKAHAERLGISISLMVSNSGLELLKNYSAGDFDVIFLNKVLKLQYQEYPMKGGGVC